MDIDGDILNEAVREEARNDHGQMPGNFPTLLRRFPIPAPPANRRPRNARLNRTQAGNFHVLGQNSVQFTQRHDMYESFTAAAAYYHRSQIEAAIFENGATTQRIWGHCPTYGFSMVEVEIFGVRESDEELSENDYYKRSFLFASWEGRADLRSKIRTWLESFSTLGDLARLNEVGSDRNSAVHIRYVKLTLIGELPPAGGASQRAGIVPAIKWLTPEVALRNIPSDFRWYRGEGNCFFRCLAYRLFKRPEYKPIYHKLVMPKFVSTIRKDLGLGPIDPLTIDQALEAAKRLDIEVNIWLVKGGSNKLVPPRTNRTDEEWIPRLVIDNIVLSEADKHYYLLAKGEDCRVASKHAGSRVHCEICGLDVPHTTWDQHVKDHYMARDEYNLQRALRVAQEESFEIERGEHEPLDVFAERYCDYYATKVDMYVTQVQMQPLCNKLLWLAGPGGCGKTYVLNKVQEKLQERGWNQSNIAKVAFVAKAAEAIGGCTIDRYFGNFRLLKDFKKDGDVQASIAMREKLEKLKMIVIEEISMVTREKFEQMDAMCRKYRGVEKPFGGLAVLILGDFLQLPPVSKGSEEIDWAYRAKVFQEAVVPLWMGYGFRYLMETDDEEMGYLQFQFLQDLRVGITSHESFNLMPYKFITEAELVGMFDKDERPTYLSHRRDDVHNFQKMALDHDMRQPGVTRVKIPTYFFAVTNDPESSLVNERPMPPLIKARAQKLAGRHVYETNPPEYHMRQDFSGDSDVPLYWSEGALFLDQKIMVLKNYCGLRRDDPEEKGLVNGELVQFQGVDDESDALIVWDKHGIEWMIPAMTQYKKITDTEWHIIQGYPIQDSAAYTVHKAQGVSLPRVAYNIPRSKFTPVHISYVALSRCRDARQTYLILTEKDGVRTTPDWANPEIQSARRQIAWMLFSKGFVNKVNESCLEIMESAKCGNFKVPDEVYLEDNFGISSYTTYKPLTNCGQEKWRPRIPRHFPAESELGARTNPEQEKRYLTHNTMFFDVETGASVTTVNHPDFFDEKGEWISQANTDRLLQKWWLVGSVYYREGQVVWCKNHDELEPFKKYQDPKSGAMRFHHGLLNRKDLEDPDWTERIFFEYLMAVVEMNINAFERIYLKARREWQSVRTIDKTPLMLCGYNIDSFDVLGVLSQFTKRHKWFEMGLEMDITPNVGSRITTIQLVKRYGKEKKVYLHLHDIFRVTGGIMGLDKAHKCYAASFKDSGPAWKDSVEYMDQAARRRANQGLTMGKGKFPHVLTQREGVYPTLDNEWRDLYADDFVSGDQDAVEKMPTLLRQRLTDASWQYMLQDLDSTFAVYIGVDFFTRKAIQMSVLKIGTAQMLTTYRFLHSTMENMVKPKFNSIITSINNDANGGHTQRQIYTNLPLYPKKINDFIKQAIYGGKTLPRIRYFYSNDPERNYYMKGDIGGMYAYAQQEYPYPFGTYFYREDDPYAQGCVKAMWKKAQQLKSPEFLAFPSEVSPFPHLFIAHVKLKWPSLCIEPGVAFKRFRTNGSYELLWGICDVDELGNPKDRVQTLTNVDLAIALKNGAELHQVYTVEWWSSHGKILSHYLEEINQEKYIAEDQKNEGGKAFAKLCANAFYGSCLKQKHNSVIKTFHFAGDYGLADYINSIDHQSTTHNENGTVTIRGTKLDDGRPSARSTSIGAFVLSYSHWDLNNAVQEAYGPCFNPRTYEDLKEALQWQILYGDTDSLYFHRSHLKRLLEHDELNPTKRILYDPKKETSSAAKLGKFADECEPDADKREYTPDLATGQFVRIVKFASNAPKTYTHEGRMPTKDGWTSVYSSKCKGVPKKGAVARIVPLGDEPVPEPYKDIIKFDGNSKKLHEYMDFAISSNKFKLATFAKSRLKLFGSRTQDADKYTDNNGTQRQVNPYTVTATNLNRQVCSDKDELRWKGRRILTEMEAFHLGFNLFERRRIYVPIGFNYDGMLFKLKPKNPMCNNELVVLDPDALESM